MQPPISILVYGLDPALNGACKLILKESGYLVCTAVDASAFNLLACNQPIDLLILADSLSLEESLRAIALASVWRPEVKSLVLGFNESGYPGALICDLIEPIAEPHRLLAAVHELVGPALAESVPTA